MYLFHWYDVLSYIEAEFLKFFFLNQTGRMGEVGTLLII